VGDERRPIATILRIQRHPDADRRWHFSPIDTIRPGGSPQERLGDRSRLFVGSDLREDHHEFVAPEAAHRV
jgi:hypothetical protein